MRPTPLVLLSLLLASCQTDKGDSAVTCDTTPQLTWQNFADGFTATYCRSCHSASSADRLGAPEAINFDTLDELVGFSEMVRSAVLDRESMPVGGGVYPEDLLQLQWYLDCNLGD